MAEPTSRAPSLIPFTVIGGFLGAGKTTLLNRILTRGDPSRMAVLVNDFGALNIDADLIAAQGGRTIRLENGCVCCTIGNDLIGALLTVLRADPRPERILVEASGVADPGRVADVARLSPSLTLDRKVVLVDSEQVRQQSTDPHVGDMVVRQLACADVLVLNKRDLIPAEDLADVRRWVEDRAPGARILEAERADVPLESLYGPSKSAVLTPHHDHHDLDGVWTRSFETDRPFDRGGFEDLIADLPPAVVRVKGFVRFTENPGFLHTLQRTGPRWTVSQAPDGLQTGVGSRLVILGTGDTSAGDDLVGLLAALVAD